MSITAPQSASDTSAATTSTQAAPASLSAGEEMLLVIGWNIGTGPTTVTNPPGWTQIGTDVVNGSTVALRALKKTAASGDVGAVYSFSLSAAVKSVTGCLAYPGGTDFGVIATQTDSAGTTHAAPALSGMQAGGTSWAINIYAERSSTNTSWAPSGADTQRVNQLGSGGGAVSLLIADSNAGVASRAAQTATAGISSVGAMMSLELLATAGIGAPSAPTGVTATPGNGAATVAFTPGSLNGAGSATYTVTSTPGSFTHTGSGSPITVSGLTNGTGYTFTVQETTTGGSATSSASGSVTPTGSVAAYRGWGINLTPGVKVTPPVTAGTLIGIAPSSSNQSQASWDATGGPNAANLKIMRWYSSSMPSTWSAGPGNGPVGPTQWLYSVNPDIQSTIAKAQDAAIAKLAASIPAGVYLTPLKEPEVKGRISPSDFGKLYDRFYSVAKAANPALNIGPILITGTSNARATDSFGNIAGRNVWAEAIANLNTPVDFYGLDGYQGQGNGTNISDIFGQPTAVAKGLFGSNTPMVVGEFGYHTTGTPDATIQSWMINGYKWFNSNGYVIACWWNGTNFVLDNPCLKTLGGLA